MIANIFYILKVFIFFVSTWKIFSPTDATHNVLAWLFLISQNSACISGMFTWKLFIYSICSILTDILCSTNTCRWLLATTSKLLAPGQSYVARRISYDTRRGEKCNANNISPDCDRNRHNENAAFATRRASRSAIAARITGISVRVRICLRQQNTRGHLFLVFATNRSNPKRKIHMCTNVVAFVRLLVSTPYHILFHQSHIFIFNIR
jgi:hypothetical protein